VLGFVGDVPGGGVVPVDGGTVPGEVGPVITVVIGGTVETVDGTGGGGEVTVQRTTESSYNSL